MGATRGDNTTTRKKATQPSSTSGTVAARARRAGETQFLATQRDTRTRDLISHQGFDCEVFLRSGTDVCDLRK